MESTFNLEAIQAAAQGDLETLQRLLLGSKYIYQGVLETAAVANQLDTLLWLKRTLKEQDLCIESYAPQFGGALAQLTLQGNLNVLKWLLQKKFPFDNILVASWAARSSQLHILQWIHQKFGMNSLGQVLKDILIQNHSSVLQWMTSIQFSWTDHWETCIEYAQTTETLGKILPFINRPHWDTRTMDYAIQVNCPLEVLKWLVAQGFPLTRSSACVAVARADAIELLSWMVDTAPAFPLSGSLYSLAGSLYYPDSLQVMQWCWDHEVPLETHPWTQLLQSDRVNELRWLIDHGCPPPVQSVSFRNLVNCPVERFIRTAYYIALLHGVDVADPPNVTTIIKKLMVNHRHAELRECMVNCPYYVHPRCVAYWQEWINGPVQQTIQLLEFCGVAEPTMICDYL